MKKVFITDSKITVNESVAGDTLERRIARRLENGEPLGEERPIIYTDKKDGVLPGFDIRTDRFEIALDAKTAIEKSKATKRANMSVVKDEKDPSNEGKNEGNNEPNLEAGSSQ